jgi:hypothetical protein
VRHSEPSRICHRLIWEITSKPLAVQGSGARRSTTSAVLDARTIRSASRVEQRLHEGRVPLPVRLSFQRLRFVPGGPARPEDGEHRLHPTNATLRNRIRGPVV